MELNCNVIERNILSLCSPAASPNPPLTRARRQPRHQHFLCSMAGPLAQSRLNEPFIVHIACLIEYNKTEMYGKGTQI